MNYQLFRIILILVFYTQCLLSKQNSTESFLHLNEEQRRNSSTWGRLYLLGWPQTIQYFQAMFGSFPPLGRKKFLFVDSLDTCSPINSNIVVANTIILTMRGNCSFLIKAENAAKASAAGIVIVNNEDGIEHLSALENSHVNISVTSISQLDGLLLYSYLNRLPNLPNNVISSSIEGYLVPIECTKSSSVCLPITSEEREMILNDIYFGGELLFTR